MIRAIRLELVKPLDASWEEVGPTMHTLRKATPKLLNAAMDARVAIGVAGTAAVKAAIAPDAKTATSSGLPYQAVLRAVESLRAWGVKKGHSFARLEVPGGMSSAISRAACQAYAERDSRAPRFASERILLRGEDGLSFSKDDKGVIISCKLTKTGSTRFAVAWSSGEHRKTVEGFVSGKVPYGAATLKYDTERKKWYAIVAYDIEDPAPVTIDPARAIAVHRGARNALYLVTTTGNIKGLPGSKFVAQRRSLQARMRDFRQVSQFERGSGAKGHGRTRRFESYGALENKIERITHTFCQQMAASVSHYAKLWGCGLIIIEDYGGIEPSEERALRRVLDRFPLFELKQAVTNRVQRDGHSLKETPSAYISSTCPRCLTQDTRLHNTRTNVFHCNICGLERPADFVAGYWMLAHSGVDMSVWEKRFELEARLAGASRTVKEGASDGE